MTHRLHVAALTSLIIVAAPAIAGDWVSYHDETETRLIADPSVGVDDVEEKDFAWGDVDLDGDIDVVVVRKQGWSSSGRRRNVLLLNEDGVLVDRTVEFATASDVPGDQGFLTPTNDRDVLLVDLNGDSFLDIVTATTLSDDQPKHIGHPRIYVNLGFEGGVWLGFRHEDARMPAIIDDNKQVRNPRFNAVAAGDLTGDGFPDLYFGDTDIPADPIGGDTDDRLLANDGNGYFTDESSNLMTASMLDSAMATAVAIVDMNGDGFNDVVKTTSLTSPIYVAIIYHASTGPGFDFLDPIYNQSPIFLSVGDLNGDTRPDIVITDDGTDRYLLNIGNDAEGRAEFTAHTFPGSSGFGGNSLLTDLDHDGVTDVVITDVDIEISGCSRASLFLRSDGGVPNPAFTADVPAGIEDSDRSGTHDVAVFDLDGDGFRDLVLGRCNGLRVWIGDPPAFLEFAFLPQRPVHLEPGVETSFDVQVVGVGGVVPAPGTGVLHLSVDDGPFVPLPMVPLADDVYRGTFPAASCDERLSFYVSAEATTGGTFTDPPGAPAERYVAYVSGGTNVVFQDSIEGDVSAWSVENDASLATGAWEQADPNATFSGGFPVSPEDDATAGPGNVFAFVTENGPAGGGAGETDVDGGPTWLISPRFELAGADAVISYARWFVCDDIGAGAADFLVVDVSNDDGVSWTPVPEETTGGTQSQWETSSFVVGDYVVPTALTRVRFGTSDFPNDSITDAGIDDFSVARFVCTVCPADQDGDGSVGFPDLLMLLVAWGPCDACPADLDGDGDVAFFDLLLLLAAWGDCG